MRNDTRRAGPPQLPPYTHSTKMFMFYFIYLGIRKKSKILNLTPRLSTLLKGPHSQVSLRGPRSDDCPQFFEPTQPPDRTGSDRWAPAGLCRSFLQPNSEVGACFLYPRRTPETSLALFQGEGKAEPQTLIRHWSDSNLSIWGEHLESRGPLHGLVLTSSLYPSAGKRGLICTAWFRSNKVRASLQVKSTLYPSMEMCL